MSWDFEFGCKDHSISRKDLHGMGKRCYLPIFQTTTSCVMIRAAASAQSFAQGTMKRTV